MISVLDGKRITYSRVMKSTVGMYGDLQGIVGKTLQEIESLELRLLEADE